ncbi:uncharacterized protein LOC110870625 [Helianthus annuus]|uniref:uncharacterized protein LOC110870625 n=1 Tax=Helianthus annuus TaxID=4232 RepID=UPI000B8F7EA6|nr:uncharacterized protein LOC110870625 [Helianthus annuus]
MEVRQIIKDNNLTFCAILETHVDVTKLDKVCRAVFRNWEWTSNGGLCDKGTRIIIGWNPSVVDVMVLAQTAQVVHVQIVFKKDKRMLFCSIVYAANYYVSVQDLWHHLSMHKSFVDDKPWAILGDFNSALNLEDKSLGASTISADLYAIFQPCRLSDHCPCVLRIPDAGKARLKAFNFSNFLVHKPEFLDTVKTIWDTSVNGVYQFQVAKKMRLLKHPLRLLLFKQGNLNKKVEDLRQKLDVAQQEIDRQPLCEELRIEEVNLTCDFQQACLDEERFLKQKSKVDWLRAGDSNTAFFHVSLKNRNHRSRIDVIMDTNGISYDSQNVPKAFVQHYENFLGCVGDTSLSPSPELFSNVLNPDIAGNMTRLVTVDEVKKAMFAIGSDKAPGPDGYSSAFFKSAWPIIGQDVSNAIIDFFNTGKLLRELNHTLIVLVPKKSTPSVVTDYRPIACFCICSGKEDIGQYSSYQRAYAQLS